MDKEVSLDSAEEAERLVGWGCKVSLMDIQQDIFYLRVISWKREMDQERLYLMEVSSLQHFEARKNFDSTASSDWGAIGKRLGSNRGGDFFE